MTDTYEAAKAEARKLANATGFDFGVEHNAIFKMWRYFMLPSRQNRRGHELRCEVVSCDVFDNCKPGHGPNA